MVGTVQRWGLPCVCSINTAVSLLMDSRKSFEALALMMGILYALLCLNDGDTLRKARPG